MDKEMGFYNKDRRKSMKNNLFVVIGILLLPVILLSKDGKEGGMNRKNIEIESQICSPRVNRFFMKGLSSIYVVLALFSIDDTGRPKDIQVLDKAKTTDWQEVRNCVTKWVFKGFSNGDRFSVAWSWKHGLGWSSMTIKGPNFKQTIQLEDLIVKITEERE